MLFLSLSALPVGLLPQVGLLFGDASIFFKSRTPLLIAFFTELRLGVVGSIGGRFTENDCPLPTIESALLPTFLVKRPLSSEQGEPLAGLA